MTKWFDTNYHYLVPEIGPATAFRFADDRAVRELAEGLAEGVLTRPVLVGPVTFLLLDRLDDLVPVYAELLRALAAAGATWVQLDEPALVSDSVDVTVDAAHEAVRRAYTALAGDLRRPDRPAILLAAPYGDLGATLDVVAGTEVEGIGLDLVRGRVPNGPVPGLAGRTVVAGVVDGHNVWRADLGAALDRLDILSTALGPDVTVAAGTSTSLLHVPHDVDDEPDLDPTLRTWLAFADQKVR